MPAREESIEIAAGADEIFRLTHDYGRRLEWDPLLKEARLLDGAAEAGRHVRVWCAAKDRLGGVGLESEYVTFDPPRVAAVRMTRGPAFLASFSATLRHEPAGNGRTRVVYRFNLTTRPRWLRRLFDPLLAGVFAWETRRRLAALKRAVEAARGTASDSTGYRG